MKKELNEALMNSINVFSIKIGGTGDEYMYDLNSMTQARVRDNQIVKKRDIRLVAIVKAGEEVVKAGEEAKEVSWPHD